MSTRVTCPGGCGWEVTFDLPSLQAELDEPFEVVNQMVDRVPAASVVDAVVLGHVDECKALRAWLRGRGYSPAGWMKKHPLPSVRKRFQGSLTQRLSRQGARA